MNREAWLTEMAKQITPMFAGMRLAEYRVTCGWPCKNALGRGATRVGECHSPKSSKGAYHEIFISPLLDKPLEVAGTLTHELAHVAAGVEAAHGKKFVAVCKHVGLTKGKATQVMPGTYLDERLNRLIEQVGQYPHTALVPLMKTKEAKVTSLSLECVDCGCKASIGIKWVELSGLPVCGCGGEFSLPE